MFRKRCLFILIRTFAFLPLLLGACQVQHAVPSLPISPSEPRLRPTATHPPEPAASVDCSPNIHASSIVDVAGAWTGISGLPGKVNLELSQDGTYAIKLVEPNSGAGVPAGFVIDNGKYRFDGAQLKFENASCQDAKGNLFACVGIYEACVTKQGTQSTQLKLIAIGDKFSGRRIGLTSKSALYNVQPLGQPARSGSVVCAHPSCTAR